MDNVNALDFYNENYEIKEIKFFIKGKEFKLDLDLYMEGLLISEADSTESIKFCVSNRNGIDEFIATCTYCIYTPYELTVELKSNFGSTILYRLYVGKFDYVSNQDITECIFYGSLSQDCNIKTEPIDYLIEVI